MDSRDPDDLRDPLGDTARIDRRKRLLAQIEAALLADKLRLEEARQDGNDPYNTGVYKTAAPQGVWQGKRRG